MGHQLHLDLQMSSRIADIWLTQIVPFSEVAHKHKVPLLLVHIHFCPQRCSLWLDEICRWWADNCFWGAANFRTQREVHSIAWVMLAKSCVPMVQMMFTPNALFSVRELLCPWVTSDEASCPQLPRSSIAELSHPKLIHSNGRGAFYYDAIHINVLLMRSSINMFPVCRWCM